MRVPHCAFFNMKKAILLVPLLASVSLACGGGGGAGSNPITSAPGSIGFTVQDAGVDTFSVVDITIDELRLRNLAGTQTSNLLPAPRTFDFLGLNTKQALLALVSTVPQGNYDQLEMVVSGVSVLDLAGLPVGVSLVGTSDEVDLTLQTGSPLAFDGSFSPCAIDIDLDRSFSPDPGNPGDFLFDLSFAASPSASTLLDEFRATVASIDIAGSRFFARIIDDGVAGNFGLLEVRVADGDYLVHDDGRTFNTAAAFLDELDPGEIVQISGTQGANGIFHASRVIEEDDGPSGSNRIEFEGEVRSINTGAQTFELLIKEIEKGASIANPVLAVLPNPNLITVSFTSSTPIFADDSSSSGTGLVNTTLAPGLEVDVRFATFAGSGPFAASSIEVGDGGSGSDDGIEYEGDINDISGLPASFGLTLDNSDSAVLSGLVSAPVSVSLSGGPSIFLDAGPEPSLSSSDLLLNHRVKVYGLLNGPPNAAGIAANRIKVKPGELEGSLTAVDLGASTITVTISRVDRHFGGASNPSGSVIMAVAPTAELETDADGTALADFAALLSGGAVDIKLEGIADGLGGWVVWEMEQD